MPSPANSVFCPAGRFTQVTWGTFTPFRTYRYSAPGVQVQWRRYSAGIPFYWEGQFTGQGDFIFPPWPYVSLEFNPSSDVFVAITVL